MGINWGGIAAAYQGAKEEQRRIADDERRATEAAEAKREAEFRDELRGRQRTEWTEADRIKAADKKDRDEVNAEFDAKNKAAEAASPADVAEAEQAAQVDSMREAITAAQAPPELMPGAAPGVAQGSQAFDPKAPVKITAPANAASTGSPLLAPAVASKLGQAKAAGMPAAHNFNDSLDRSLEILRRRNARGDLSAEDYAQKAAFLKRAQNEGVSDAINLFSQGRYEDAMKAYNSVGQMRGARIVKAEQGTTKINGEDVPTHFVTVRNPDGSRTTIDSAKAQYQLLDFNTQLSHADRSRTFQAQQAHNAEVLQMQKDEAAARRRDAAEARSIQRAALEAGTPAGKIRATERALGRKLTEAEKAAQFGIDTMPPTMRAQLNNLLKQQEQIAQSINKAQAEGTWQEGTEGAKALTTREAMLQQRVNDLLTAAQGAKAGADPLGILTPPPAATGPAAQPAATGQPGAPNKAPGLPPVGGIPMEERRRQMEERNRQMEAFNKAVAGSSSRARFEAAQEERKADLEANFDTKIAQLKRGMPRAEAHALLEWFAAQEDADNLNNAHRAKLRRARQAAGY